MTTFGALRRTRAQGFDRSKLTEDARRGFGPKSSIPVSCQAELEEYVVGLLKDMGNPVSETVGSVVWRKR